VRNAQGVRRTVEREYSSVPGGIKNGKLEGNKYNARKLRDKVVDQEGTGAYCARESVGCMNLTGDKTCGCEDRRHVCCKGKQISVTAAQLYACICIF
jgi:hypothetical protein